MYPRSDAMTLPLSQTVDRAQSMITLRVMRETFLCKALRQRATHQAMAILQQYANLCMAHCPMPMQRRTMQVTTWLRSRFHCRVVACELYGFHAE